MRDSYRNMIKFPYGIADFYKLITKDYLYVDRTASIRQVEDVGINLLFLRPRRFGKSLWLSVLENYYDVNKAAQFETLFGHLAIGQNPTPEHNQYLIMRWNFSAVATHEDVSEIRKALHNHINGAIQNFAEQYESILTHSIEINHQDALSSFNSALTATNLSPYKMYLLIDEYDNFANEVLMSNLPESKKRYEDMLYNEGALKTLFKVVKMGTEGRGIDRLFITGISPVVMSDITSGFNIAENIYLESTFNDLCGFHEEEIAHILHQVAHECQLSLEMETEALDMMRTFYNGYQFSYDAEQLVYNPTLVLYFLKALQKHCRYPHNMLDENLAMDRNKIAYVSRMPQGNRVITTVLNEDQPLAIDKLSNRFGVRDILFAVKDTTFITSLLYYFGVLTLMPGYTPFGELIFKIPNLVVRKLYVERLKEMALPNVDVLEESNRVIRIFYQTGDLQPLCNFMEETYFALFNNRDLRWANELTIKTAFLSLLFNDTFYIMDSEKALRLEYSDLTMIVRPDMRRFQLQDMLLEFKYVSLGKNKLTCEKVRAMSMTELKNLAPVQTALSESKTKLTGYRQTLNKVYGAKLRLRVYSVVAIGFDKLVWVEL